ncbi:MAG: riboflavin synthase [Thermodesulfovibrionales bacterium]
MFTGLVLDLGEIVSIKREAKDARLVLKAAALSKDAVLGDSIAVNGVCLTVVERSGEALSFDVSYATLKATNIGELKAGDRVNLEPALRMDGRLGGHFVTGHVDCVGTIASRESIGDGQKIVVRTDPAYADLLVEKGSVAVDGISLTVVDSMRDGFSVVIIPHTARMTTIGFKQAGERVNVEVDILGKYVSKFLGKGRDAGLMKTLIREGFAS